MKNFICGALAIAAWVALFFFAGCAKQPLHPGAVNQFDSQAYDALMVAQAGINEASKQIASYPNLKPELNKVIDGYNVAMKAYKAYHAAALEGKATDQAGLDATIKQISAAIVAVLAKLKPTAMLLPRAA